MGNAVQALPVQAVRDTEMFELALCAAIPIYAELVPCWNYTWALEGRDGPHYLPSGLPDIVALALWCAAQNWREIYGSGSSARMKFRYEFAADLQEQISARGHDAGDVLARVASVTEAGIIDRHQSLTTQKIWYALASIDDANTRLADFRNHSLHMDLLEEFRKEFRKIFSRRSSPQPWYQSFVRKYPRT